MSVEEDKRGLRVLRVFDSSPARRAGIQRDDLIVAVNGRSIAGREQRGGHRSHQGPRGHAR